MLVKIDTKEKFHVITLNSNNLAANMTAELPKTLHPLLQTPVKNIVFNLGGIQTIDLPSAEALLNLQQYFYENNASFVFFGADKSLEDFLEKNEILELMNVTPTESEAWDIVQMEEIERELMDGEEEVHST
ncbi:MAG TPA: STAS domain-containing protein [Chitinophagaceae bacterium]|nr:STAS domain-containing protein [Chitinophagaceae bacterium]